MCATYRLEDGLYRPFVPASAALVERTRLIEASLEGERVPEAAWQVFFSPACGAIEWAHFERMFHARMAAAAYLAIHSSSRRRRRGRAAFQCIPSPHHILAVQQSSHPAKEDLMPNRRQLLRALTAASLLLVPSAWSVLHAQEPYPSRRVNMIVPFPPGGGADLLARVLAKRLTELWGQPVVVENKPGAAGTLGANSVGSSAPDGYTLLVGASGAITAANAKSLAPVSLLSAPPYIVAVNAALPVSSLGELIQYAKARPEKVFFASSGSGSASHLSGELFMGLTQTKLTHVPYKGMGQAVQDLVGGQVTVMFGPPPVLLPQVKAGKLKALALASRERSPLFPDIPTAAEAGVPGFEAGAWYGILAAAKTPPQVLAKISSDTARVLKETEVKETLASVGATPVGSSPEEFARFLEADVAKWDDLLRKAGVTPQ